MRRLLSALAVLGALAIASPAAAQTSTPQSAPAGTPSEKTGPATSTASGDTGLWFIPTANVLRSRTWSLGFGRTNTDDGQGFSDLSTFPVTFGVGVGSRAEIFGSWVALTRIDRDSRPLFFSSTAHEAATGTGGGILLGYPLARKAFLSVPAGDVSIGAKINLASEAEGRPLGFAIRAIAKVPTGSTTEGVSSGKPDLSVDAIASRDTHVVEVTGFGGVIVRGNPAGYKLTNGLRWGVGAAFPSRLPLRATAELFGERYSRHVITAPAGLVGADGSSVPTSTTLKDPVNFGLGLTLRLPQGFFVSSGVIWNLHMSGRSDALCASGVTCPAFTNTPKDRMGIQLQFGFHPGARKTGSAGGTTTGAGRNPRAGVTGVVGAGAGAAAGTGATGAGAGAGGVGTGGGAGTGGAAGRGASAGGGAAGAGVGAGGAGAAGAGTGGGGAAAGGSGTGAGAGAAGAGGAAGGAAGAGAGGIGAGAGGVGAGAGAGTGAGGVGTGGAAGAGAAGAGGGGGGAGSAGAGAGRAAGAAGAGVGAGGAAGAGAGGVGTGGTGAGGAGTGRSAAGATGRGGLGAGARGGAGGGTGRGNRPATVHAGCDPCIVEAGKSLTVSADAQDPDGDRLTYQWSAPSGSFTDPTAQRTPWTAPMRPGTVALTVTVSDGRGGVTRGRVTVTVTGPDTRNASFEDVHFDFDRSTLRPEATQALDAAIALMKADPALQLLIEGNTCNIGTSEYNLALGERRARAVFDYLVAHGVEAGRLSTVSYGEDRPKVDNATPANRSLNRRAALVVRLR